MNCITSSTKNTLASCPRRSSSRNSPGTPKLATHPMVVIFENILDGARLRSVSFASIVAENHHRIDP